MRKYGNGWYLLRNRLNLETIKFENLVLIPLNEISKINEYCNSSNAGTSLEEKDLYEFIENNYNGKILRNRRNIISPYELDIYIPEKKVAIEYDGLYWHSTKNLKRGKLSFKQNKTMRRKRYKTYTYF